jgi:hypothetical protein
MDQRLITQPTPLGFPLQGAEHIRVDPNSDELTRRISQWRTSDAAHGTELLVGRLREVGKVNFAPTCTPPVPYDSAGAR